MKEEGLKAVVQLTFSYLANIFQGIYTHFVVYDSSAELIHFWMRLLAER